MQFWFLELQALAAPSKIMRLHNKMDKISPPAENVKLTKVDATHLWALCYSGRMFWQVEGAATAGKRGRGQNFVEIL